MTRTTTTAPEFLAVDVTMSQAKLLYLVTAQPGIVMSALAAQLGVSLSTVSGLVDRLVEHGHIERREDPADRRQQRVTVTAEGASVVERMREKGDLYESTYSGLYCTACEAFYSEEDLVDGRCPEHGTVPEFTEERNTFFRLSAYTGALLAR